MVGVETKDLTVQFCGLTAVNDVSMRVEEGETFGLTGPNGSGRATLLKRLSQG